MLKSEGDFFYGVSPTKNPPKVGKLSGSGFSHYTVVCYYPSREILLQIMLVIVDFIFHAPTEDDSLGAALRFVCSWKRVGLPAKSTTNNSKANATKVRRRNRRQMTTRLVNIQLC